MSDEQPAPDWVTARQSWDLAAMFAELRQQVERDVQRRRVPDTWRFSGFDVLDSQHGGFVVNRTIRRGGTDSLQFTVEDESIVVVEVVKSRRFRARPIFGPEYEHLVDIEGVNGPQPLWQLSRAALEPFLFPE